MFSCIPNIDSSYRVDSRGYVIRIKNYESHILTPEAGSVHVKTLDGDYIKIRVDHAVATAFIDNPEDKPYVFHIDEDTTNCAVDNLVWAAESDLFEPRIATLPGEVWRDIPNYLGYQASNLGRIRSMSRVEKFGDSSNASCRIRRGRILKQRVDDSGYYTVNPVAIDGSARPRTVHRLVASSFIPNPYNFPQVNHKNGNKKDNSVDNLEWCSRTDNMQHAIKLNLWHPKECGRISAAATGKRVVCLTTGTHYRSITAAAKSCGMDFNSVVESIETGRPRKGLIFKYEDDE